jgi:hypothetical protein
LRPRSLAAIGLGIELDGAHCATALRRLEAADRSAP